MTGAVTFTAAERAAFVQGDAISAGSRSLQRQGADARTDAERNTLFDDARQLHDLRAQFERLPSTGGTLTLSDAELALLCDAAKEGWVYFHNLMRTADNQVKAKLSEHMEALHSAQNKLEAVRPAK